jgi:putative restriction endonuclease
VHGARHRATLSRSIVSQNASMTLSSTTCADQAPLAVNRRPGGPPRDGAPRPTTSRRRPPRGAARRGPHQVDSQGGSAAASNGLALCRIHHGAFDTNILGIKPDYEVAIRDSVLDTIDGPTLQHALKGMHGSRLGQLPKHRAEFPDRVLLDERYQSFLLAG